MTMAEHISQRELRNESGKILRAVEAGEEFVITNRGRPVARLVGVEDGAERRCILPAQKPSRPLRIGKQYRRKLSASTDELLEGYRDERI
ncbi:type II toxin-antitoxin system prevent-host-death family antitoxin [Corynebacterium sp. TA-R-1]|uniref:Antitoxin n=1 Tax=Corynebacterium stercoris TaxID=2943490 RepID=A0ABT1G2T5_9CORY|nr:type II toxin-antitoxin system prevent-host-death family antitoxin [Corynebacterium stercoris]MCP1388301.1 type II toxin-antitoxin system prevent-host-death family antitoxin [Corynebacterium stercoris]